jgi:hypothetical protein
MGKIHSNLYLCNNSLQNKFNVINSPQTIHHKGKPPQGQFNADQFTANNLPQQIKRYDNSTQNQFTTNDSMQ